MKAYLTPRHAAAAAVAGVLAAVSLSSIALAITDTVFRYSEPKTGYYSINSGSLTPRDTTSADNYSNSGNDGGLIVNAQTRCFLAGVNLPSGVTMTTIRVWYESGATGNPVITLFAHELATGQGITIANLTIMDSSATRNAVNLPLPAGVKINNRENAYALNVCIAPNDVFYAVRITYNYDNAGD